MNDTNPVGLNSDEIVKSNTFDELKVRTHRKIIGSNISNIK